MTTRRSRDQLSERQILTQLNLLEKEVDTPSESDDNDVVDPKVTDQLH